ncbi:MAG: formate--tetrahydrofolate ligase [Candidatus Cloacimonas sp. 4484_209]|nr:MAG: formate--tetrahydrofolate ligase [Candidatus Cloacimonas sp. 4484_209]
MSEDAIIGKFTKLKHIYDIAHTIGLEKNDIELYGDYKAKIKLSVYERMKNKKDGKLILVSAMTPTPAGEGKTTVAIGLSLGLNKLGYKSIVTLREPSLGPLFGMKGGATGGGRAQVLPMGDINLHFTGDIHAITSAHNLISASLDNHIFRRKEPQIDPRRIEWERVMDMNDRSLRNIVIGLGGRKNGFPREATFHISAASEIMAILCLSETFGELKNRISNILLGFTYSGEPVYLKDLKISGAVAALLKDAIKPNLVQTTEGTPAFVHGGPFANIAQGTCSSLSMELALKLSQYVITEAGFGFDLGAEKFFDIVARKSHLNPKLVVLVATIRALKMHGGKKLAEIKKPDPNAVTKGLSNLKKHLENIAMFHVPAIIAINKFTTDTKEEIEVVKRFANSLNVPYAVAEEYSKGGNGMKDLAKKVVELANHRSRFRLLYKLNIPVEKKITKVCKKIYGSKAVDFTKEAKHDLRIIKKLGLEQLPVCIAKTQKSLSDNPKLLGRPEHFLITVRQIKISSGAGFLVPITGDILLMPGLPTVPVAENVDIDEEGNITGLF